MHTDTLNIIGEYIGSYCAYAQENRKQQKTIATLAKDVIANAEDLLRYMTDRNELLSKENAELRRELSMRPDQQAKIDELKNVIRRQRKQLHEVQNALERRNEEIRMLKGENARLLARSS